MDSLTVLVVDENLTFLRIARRFLEEIEGVVVIGTIQGGDDLLERVQAMRPDVVLLDITTSDLPGGIGFISRLRSVLPAVKIIALTLINTDGYRQAALEAGADMFLPKADMGMGLLSAIQRIQQIQREAARRLSHPASAGSQPVGGG